MRRSWIALLAVAFAACSDGGTGPGEASPAFTADQSLFLPWQVAVLTLNGAAPAGDVEGSLGTASVTLMPAGDSAVALMVPDVSGTHTLSFTVGGRTYSGSMTVTAPPPIVDGQQYVQAFAADAESRVAEVEASFAELEIVDPRALEMLELVRDSMAAFRARITQLTPEQAQQAAQVLQANRLAGESAQRMALAAGVVHATAYGAIPRECSSRTTALQKYRCTWDQFILKMADATIGLAGGALAFKVLAPMPWVALVVGGALVIDGGIDAAHAFAMGFELLRIHGMIAAEIARQTGELLWEGGTAFFRAHIYDPDAPADLNGFAMSAQRTPPASMTSFTNGGATSFVFAPQLRPVRAADRTLGLDFLREGLTLVNRYNSLIARFGTRYQLNFAAPATSYAPNVPFTEIDVKVVQNQNVRVRRVSGSGSRVDVTFETDAATVQDFSYDIVYTSGVYPPLRVRYHAKLHPASYRLGALSDTTLLGDTIRMYGRMQNIYLLMHDDGSLAPNEMFHLYTTTTAPTGVYFDVSGNGGHYVYLTGAITAPGVLADTFAFNIVDNLRSTSPRTLLNATVILHDSATVYANGVTGTWIVRTYPMSSEGEWLSESRVFRFDADGTGQFVSLTRYSTNAPPSTETHNTPLEWTLRVSLNEGRPVHSLEYVLQSSRYTFPLSYPVTGWTRIWSYGSSSYRDVWSRS